MEDESKHSSINGARPADRREPTGIQPQVGVTSSTQIVEQAWMQTGRSLYQAIAELKAESSTQRHSNNK